MRLVVVTGLSGAGKTTALQALEDLGYFSADNLPPSLWRALLERAEQQGIDQVVVGVDVRTRAFLDEVPAVLRDLANYRPEIVFLDASDDVLVQRYNFTRRTHPLGQAPLASDIAAERRTLGDLRASADEVIDTSGLSARQLGETLRQRFAASRRFRVRLMSFGFKRGVPIDADVMLDVRSFPNPFYDPALRPQDGRDEAVQNHVFRGGGLQFYSELREFVRLMVGRASSTGRSSYTVAVGCTGGQHRSVAVAERLFYDLSDSFDSYTHHRDLDLALREHQHAASDTPASDLPTSKPPTSESDVSE